VAVEVGEPVKNLEKVPPGNGFGKGAVGFDHVRH
jgi:hypothetical protein